MRNVPTVLLASLALVIAASAASAGERKAAEAERAAPPASTTDVSTCEPAASGADDAGHAREVTAAIERWSADGEGGTPEFERHIVPLLGKAGCNGRACHGSFQGQNGFRLSLFGHDAKMDHDELTGDEESGSRVDVDDPAYSLALLKPTDQEPHDGGLRFEVDSWQYRMIRSWIEAGAKWNPGRESRLERLEVLPREARLAVGEMADAAAKREAQLRAVAHFSDGTSEDVTALTIFSTNDESVATVDEAGRVTSAGPGDTAIVATYGGAVVTSQMIVPHAALAGGYPEYPIFGPIDALVLAKLKKLNIEPSPLAGDEVFLRRVYLDLIGTLPTAAEAREFLTDTRPDKRTRLIDRLLERPEYAMYWATKFSDWTGNDNRFTPQPREKTGWLWHNWLRDKLARNVSYDEIAAGFLLATSREGRSADEYIAEYKEVRDRIADGFDEEIYPRRKTNDMFYMKGTNGSPDTVALQVAYAFLGVRLECAQCHKHPFDRWTQDDFQGFSAIFAAVQRGVPDDVPEEMKKRDPNNNAYRYLEVYVRDGKDLAKRYDKQPPKILAGDVIDYEAIEDPRAALVEWMRSPDNPYFAAAIANRLWGHYFGRGIVDPVDDLSAANPPSNPQLLEWLAKDFITSGFDLKHLHRTILNGRTYQLSWTPNETNRLDERNFSHAVLRRMPAEVVMDAINQVTGGHESYSRNNAPADTRTINLALSRLRGGGPEYVLTIFGRPLRTQICDCERGTATGLAQAMYLLNDTDINGKIEAADGRLAALVDEIGDDAALVEELYLATLSRMPTTDEMSRAMDYVAAAPSREQGMQDVLWSLLNLREFIFVH